MLVSYVVRLVPEQLQRGVLSGEVQVVATGERVVVRSADALLAALQRPRPALRPRPGRP
jgi:hypothetical protein